MTAPDDLTSTRAAIEAAERAFSGDIRCSRSGGQTCAKCNDGAECSVCYTQRHGRVLLAEVRRLTDADMADRLRDLATDLAPFGCRPTMDAVKVLDYARVAIFDLIRERDQLREELTIAENARDRLAADRTAALATALLDRALQAQHEPEGLHVVHAALVEALADAHTDGREPGVSATVPDETLQAIEARLNAASDAYYEQLAPRCSYRSAGDGMACGLMSGHDGPHTMLIPPSNGWGLVADTTKDLRALLSGVRRLTDANDAIRGRAAEYARTSDDATRTREDIILSLVKERDDAVAALATARLDGARAMRERCIIVCENVEGEADADGESGRALAAHHIAQRISNLTLDPAAVVGSPEPALAECPGCEGSGSVSPSGCIRCPACEGSGTVPAAVVGSGS